jgi:CHASE2 domain-containing sensor protein
MAFWLVKFMDLGIVVPIAAATGIGLLRGRSWANRLAFAMIGGYALLAASVTGMAIAMQLNDDPSASLANTIVFAAFFLAFGALAFALYLPLFRTAGSLVRVASTTEHRHPSLRVP